MSFTDPSFLFFFCPMAIIFFLFAGKFGSQSSNAALLTISLIFSYSQGGLFSVLIILTAAINYLIVRSLITIPLTSENYAVRDRLFYVGLFIDLGLLCIVKYTVVFKIIPPLYPPLAAFAATVGVTISFLTFQRVALLIGAHKNAPEVRDLLSGPFGWLRYSVFVMMFQNLVIGPIAYVSEIGGQLSRYSFGRPRRVDLEIGLTLLVIGLAKKLLIADKLDDAVVEPVFGAAGSGLKIPPLEAVSGIIGFYFQLYFDFSGYSDMALGVARMFGLLLPINFNSPLRATGIVDFYKRWHISLTRLIATFIFTPLVMTGARFASEHDLSGWRSKIFSAWIPLIINFQIIAIWHGAQFTYLLFGVYHGLWFILENEVRSSKIWKSYVKSTSPLFRRTSGQALTVIPLSLSFALFKSSSVAAFGNLLSCLDGPWLQILYIRQNRVTTNISLVYLVMAAMIVWLLPNAYELLRNYRPGIFTYQVPSTTPVLLRLKWRPTPLWALLYAGISIWILFSLTYQNPFVYGGF